MKKARKYNPLSRDKGIKRSRHRDDSDARTVRQGLQLIIIIMLKNLLGKVDHMHVQMGNLRRKMKLEEEAILSRKFKNEIRIEEFL